MKKYTKNHIVSRKTDRNAVVIELTDKDTLIVGIDMKGNDKEIMFQLSNIAYRILDRINIGDIHS